MSMSQGKINSNDTMNKQRQTFCLMLLMFKSVRYSAWDSFGVNFWLVQGFFSVLLKSLDVPITLWVNLISVSLTNKFYLLKEYSDRFCWNHLMSRVPPEWIWFLFHWQTNFIYWRKTVIGFVEITWSPEYPPSEFDFCFIHKQILFIEGIQWSVLLNLLKSRVPPRVNLISVPFTNKFYLLKEYSDRVNRPFPSYPLPLFQNESTCKTIHVHFHANQSHFHFNGFARRLVLKLR